MPPSSLYHCTTFNGFKGIVSGHDGKLRFRFTRSEFLNDRHELNWVYRNKFFPKSSLKPSYILSLSKNRNFAKVTNCEYGNITLVLSTRFLPIYKINMQQCVYTDSKCQKIKCKMFFNRILSSFSLHIQGHFIKGKEWEKEQEWRIVENAQIGEHVSHDENSKKEYIEREYPLDCLIVVLITPRQGEDSDALRNKIRDILTKYNSKAEVQIQ